MKKLTEAEAEKRWCPFARVAFVGQNVMNRISSFHMELAQKSAERGDTRDLEHYQRQERDTYCIGSRCMAWRWSNTDPEFREVDEPLTGYCGLAGSPKEVV